MAGMAECPGKGCTWQCPLMKGKVGLCQPAAGTWGCGVGEGLPAEPAGDWG